MRRWIVRITQLTSINVDDITVVQIYNITYKMVSFLSKYMISLSFPQWMSYCEGIS